MVIFTHRSACELASGILFPHITTNFLDEIDTAWVNVDVIVLNELNTINDGILTLAAWPDTIHAKLISKFRDILGIQLCSH